ncbi:MAG TPA: DEAD/DEAH box helicase, partial [Acidimicrobiales bacterium]|nr:DEAD/DEAH box helicase [Acidimicrobiales bacterium]
MSLQLDQFQRDAVAALDAGRSVLVVAPTGAGKTLIADHAVDRALAAGGKAFYTTPLKALSNQKHRDLAARLGPDRVGLMTGDRIHQPGAPVVVMTTEVLRALLYERAAVLDGLAAVVLDEFHYLQDPDRGPVWEEVVIHSPADVALVCLSATIADVDGLADWIGRVHGPVTAVVESHRPVTLNHLYAVGNLQDLPPLLVPMHLDGGLNPVAELLDGTRRRNDRGEGLRVRSRERPVAPPRRDLLDHLARESMLPAIWFVLSRAGCDRAVAELLDAGVRLTTTEETARIRALVEDTMGWLSPADLRAVDHGAWRTALEAGIAGHHGAMVPVQREVVEAAFAAGLVKVAFATETLALGVNLPARTVVVDRVVRGDGEILGSADFAQLAGRAGRRGIDTVGHVVVPWAQDVPFHRVASLTSAEMPPPVSRFRPTPAMVANLARAHPPAVARRLVRSSYRQHRLEVELAAVRSELAALDATLAGVDGEALRCDACAGTDDPGDASRSSAADGLAALAVGDVVVDPGRPALGRVVVVATPRSRRGASAVDVVRVDGRRQVLTCRDFRGSPTVIARVDLPPWTAQERGHARRAAEALGGVPATAGLRELRVPPAVDCGHRAALRNLRRQHAERARLAERAAELEVGPDRELQALVGLLTERGHLEGWALTSSGRAVRRLFHDAGLVVAECLTAGLFAGLDAAETGALASCFTARRAGESPGATRLPTPSLRERWPRVVAIARELQRAQEHADVAVSPDPEPALAGAVHAWATGADLETALGDTGLPAGDLVREVRQVAELLHQIAAVEESPVADAAR